MFCSATTLFPRTITVLTASALAAIGFSLIGESPDATTSDGSRSVDQQLSQVPTAFIRNEGQWDDEVLYAVRRKGLDLTLESDGLRMSLGEAPLKLDFGSKAERLEGRDPQPTQYNFFLGNDEDRWRTDVQAFGSVLYDDIAEGVDVRIHEGDVGLQYDFELDAGIDADQIDVRAEGATGISLDADGSLVIDVEGEELRLTPPVAWQVRPDGFEVHVNSKFRILDRDRFGFETSTLDPNLPTVIDPQVDYATYIGGASSSDWPTVGIAVDSSGLIYVGGSTRSVDLLPTVPRHGPGDPAAGDEVAFVAKLDPEAENSLVFLSMIGGTGSLSAWDIAVGPNGAAVYLCGETASVDFPTVTVNPGLSTLKGTLDAFLVCLDTATGAELIYSVLVGGTSFDTAYSVAVDAQNNAYLTGDTGAGTSGISGGPTNTFGPLGGGDVLVSAIDMTGTLITSAVIGGTGSESPLGPGIALDQQGNVYVAGATENNPAQPSGWFPRILANEKEPVGTTSGRGRKKGGSLDGDGFLVRLTPALDVQMSTLIGGGSSDVASSLIIESGPLVHLSGTTMSSDFPTNHPVIDPSVGLDGSSLSGSEDAFVATLDFSAFAPMTPETPGNPPVEIFSTYLGFGSTEVAASFLAVGNGGNLHILGQVNGTTFPIVGSPQLSGGEIALMILSPAFPTRTLTYSTLLGGSVDSSPWALALGADDSIHFLLRTTTQNLFLSPNAAMGPSGTSDIYVRKLASPLGAAPPPTPGITVQPTQGLITTEGGGTDSFTVILDTQPTDAVSLAVSPSDPTEGAVSSGSQGPASSITLVFDGTNWDQPQTVTVNGQDDAEIDGDVDYSMITDPAMSLDADYQLLDPADVAVTNQDDDAPVPIPVTVSSVQPAQINAGASGVPFTVFGSGFQAGAQITFENGSGPTPTVTNVTVVTGGEITAQISVSGKGRKGTRLWDVRVTNGDDSSDVLADALAVVK